PTRLRISIVFFLACPPSRRMAWEREPAMAMPRHVALAEVARRPQRAKLSSRGARKRRGCSTLSAAFMGAAVVAALPFSSSRPSVEARPFACGKLPPTRRPQTAAGAGAAQNPFGAAGADGQQDPMKLLQQ
ncbi:unnamed protein product, partial [Polarella glacialis]